MPHSVTEYYQKQASEKPNHSAFFSHAPDFNATLTWKEIWDIAQNMALHIQNHGLSPNEHVGLLGPSCAEWELTQLSTFLAGGVVVGLDPHDSIASYEFIIAKCGIRRVFINGEELFNKLFPLVDKYHLTIERMDIRQFKSTPVAKIFPAPEPEKIATILFTSGTNFEPKGIQYTHHQIVLTVENILQAFPEIPPAGCRTTCWLPLSNLFQRIINFSAVAVGGTIFFVEKPQDIMHHLKSTNPHVFIAVPRFYEKVYDGIQTKISRSKSVKALFFLATIIGRRRSARIRQNKPIGPILNFFWYLADKVVFQKIRGLFGKNILFAISGSAPMRKVVLEFFHMIDILILEAYGTSENIIPIAANRVKRFKFGSVGIPLIKDSIKFSDEKEILIKGPGLFKGYLGIHDESIFEGEYYKTNDLGHFDEDGFLHIEGRKSEIFKTTTGKKIAAVEIDAAFKAIPYVDVSLTLGENRKAPVVLITLDFQKLAETLNSRVDDLWDLEDGNFITRALQRISHDLSEKNTGIPEKMRPVGFIVLTRKFVFENQEVTANLKIRRRHIEKKLVPTLDKIYLEIDSSPKTHYWFLNSEDLQMSSQSENKMTDTASGRFFQLMGLLWDITITTVSYRLLTKSSSNLNRKLGQIFRHRLGRLRGPLQKVGQMLSYMNEDLPEEFREEVRDLLRDSPPVNSFLIRSIVEAELKQPIALLFAEWRDTPLYTASIGQIHYARLKSGELVAVKVLLPKMDKIARADMLLLTLCQPIIQHALKNPSAKAHLRELRNLIVKECDFRNEALNYEMFYSFFKDHPDIIIPKVYKKLSTAKVLVTSYIDGISIDQFAPQADEPERKKIAEIIWKFHCEAINRYAIFNADPHPGNYIIVDDKVAIIDFGFCKAWDPTFIDLWKKQTLAGCRGDEAGFIQLTREMGFFKTNDQNFLKNLLPIYQDVFYRPWISDRNFRITHQYLKQYLRTIFEKIVSAGDVHVPIEFLALTRLYFEVFAIMAHLDIELNYYQLTIPYLSANTLGHNNPDIPANSPAAPAN
jgi:long-chain acyl-CoA synthetase